MSGPEAVRTPRWLVDYACRRSLVCCHAPWRPAVLPGEQAAVGRKLADAGAEATARAWSDAVVRRAGLEVLRQESERCVMLHAAEPACTVHRDGGLMAMPEACRTFPRAVAATPDGLEVAFTTGCPTVTSLVLERRGPLVLEAGPAEGFPFRPTRRAGERVAWTHAIDLGWGELVALRQAWWQRLGEVERTDRSGGAEALLAVLGALRRAPGEPDGPSEEGLSTRLEPASLTRVTASLTRLPRRGGMYKEKLREVWAALAAPFGDEAVAALESEQAAALGRATALGVQAAGVHLPGFALESMRQAARRAVEVAHVAGALGRAVATLGPDEALADALVALG